MTLALPALAAPRKPLFMRMVEAFRRNSLDIGEETVVKRRTRLGGAVTRLSNAFFRVAGLPIRIVTDAAEWQRVEVETFCRLNGPLQAQADGPDGVVEDRVPGKTLWAHLEAGTLTSGMVSAAARAFARAHRTHSPVYEGPWSHGDATMSNVVFDPATRMARLIDFELSHVPTLPAAERHADDLLTFLLDLASEADDEAWLPLALRFISAYGDAAVTAEVTRRLRRPRGLARFMWGVRTNFAPADRIAGRMAALEYALGRDQGAERSGLAGDGSDVAAVRLKSA